MARNGNQKSQLGTSAQRHETDLMRGQRTVSKRMDPGRYLERARKGDEFFY